MAQIESAGPNAIEARRALASGAVLLDVRTRGEFHEGHLPHAVNIPLQELPVRIDEVRRRARAVVVYCRSGNRSSEAAQLLASTDLSRVIDLGAITNFTR
ncbi:MAG: rhodanese-like domain-containing protein [Polyangiales bacterium]